MLLETPASPLTESSMLYTDGHTDTRTHGRTDRVIPVYPVLLGYKIIEITIFGLSQSTGKIC